MQITVEIKRWWELVWTERYQDWDQREGTFMALRDNKEIFTSEVALETRIAQLRRDPNCKGMRKATWEELQ